jgi:hypothetical protein
VKDAQRFYAFDLDQRLSQWLLLPVCLGGQGTEP